MVTDNDKLVRERIRDFIYDCTTDGFGHGWTLSAEQTDHVIAMAQSERSSMEGEILRLVDALVYAHEAGFEWPVDPLPFGSIAHNLFIERGNDPDRIAAKQAKTHD